MRLYIDNKMLPFINNLQRRENDLLTIEMITFLSQFSKKRNRNETIKLLERYCFSSQIDPDSKEFISAIILRLKDLTDEEYRAIDFEDLLIYR